MRRFFTFTKRDATVVLSKYGIALVAVMIIGALLIIAEGENPAYALEMIVSGSLGTITNIGNTIRWVIPCLMLGMSACIAFKSGVYNLGIEGQLYCGAWVAAMIGSELLLPAGVHPIVCLLAAGIAGMLLAAIPALLKLYFGVNEMISTLMLNYIANIVTEFLTLQIIGKSATTPANNIQTENILETAELPSIIPNTYANIGIFVAIAVVIAVYLIYRYTIRGYEFKTVGENLSFSKTNGVNIVSTYMTIFLLSGFVAGLAGGIEILGAHHHFTANFSKNLGWDGVMISMIAVNNPLGVAFVSVLWGILKSGSLNMERMTSLNRFTIILIQALFVLFVSIDYRAVFEAITNKRKIRMENKQERLKEGREHV